MRGNFLGNVLARSVPASVAIILAVGVASGFLEHFGLTRDQISTVCVVLTCLVGFSLVVRISLPLNSLRAALLVVVVAIVVFGCTIAGPFFCIVSPTSGMIVAIAAIGVVSLLLFNYLFTRGVALATEDEGYARFMSAIENSDKGRDANDK